MAGKLIMTKGLPGSGKTTWAVEQVDRNDRSLGANAHTYVVVCKDDIRAEQFKKEWNYDVEKEVLRVRDFRISQALSKGLTVISADTNLAPKHEASLRQLASKYRSVFEIQDFTDVPIHVCVERDLDRGDKIQVGEKVIRDMAEQFLTPSNLIPRTGSPQLFVDLDGVLADFDGFIERELGVVNDRSLPERPDFWDILRGYGGRLYFDMSPMEGASRLWEALKPFRPIVLTGVPFSIPTAAQDKRDWVAKHIDPDAHVVTCRSKSKALYAKPGDILIDDWPKYQERWLGVGGVWITHTDIDSSIEAAYDALHNWKEV